MWAFIWIKKEVNIITVDCLLTRYRSFKKSLTFAGNSLAKRPQEYPQPLKQFQKLKFQKLFKEKGLGIIVQCNLKITDYLDITLNLNDGSYRPYRKRIEETNYIHIISDHPPSIIKEIPRSIEKRLSILSSSKYIFRSQPFTMKNAKKTVVQYQQDKISSSKLLSTKSEVKNLQQKHNKT